MCKNTGKLYLLFVDVFLINGHCRYGLKVTVMIVAPHPIWVTERGLEIVGPGAFHLPYQYTSDLQYTKPQSVIEEFRPKV